MNWIRSIKCFHEFFKTFTGKLNGSKITWMDIWISIPFPVMEELPIGPLSKQHYGLRIPWILSLPNLCITFLKKMLKLFWKVHTSQFYCNFPMFDSIISKLLQFFFKIIAILFHHRWWQMCGIQSKWWYHVFSWNRWRINLQMHHWIQF